MQLSKKWKNSTNSLRIPPAECVLLGPVLLFAHCVFLYNDIWNTIDNSNILIYAVTHGQPGRFYELSVELAQTTYSANYNLPVYVVFAIWQAPFYFLASVLKRNYLDWPLAVLWSKTLVVLASAVVAALIYRIVADLSKNREKARFAVFLYYSSALTFYPIFICAQLDVFSVAFMLGGLYFFMRGEDRKVWLCFVLAAPFKMFSLLLALPLLLFRDKNLVRVTAKWVSMMALIFVEKLLFKGSLAYGYALSKQAEDGMQLIMNTEMRLGMPVIVFLLCYLLLLVMAYIVENPGEKQVLYAAFFLWGTFVGASSIRTYWIFLMIPFAVLCICMMDRYMKANVLVETIGSVCILLHFIATKTAIFSSRNLVSRLLLPAILEVPENEFRKYGSVAGMFTKRGWDVYAPVFSTVFIASVVAMLILTYPSLKKESDGKDPGQNSDKGAGQNSGTRKDAGQAAAASNPEYDRFVIFMRPVILCALTALVIRGYTAASAPVALDTTAGKTVVCETDLFSHKEAHVLTQEIEFEEERGISEITLRFMNGVVFRTNMAMLHVELWDETEQKCIAEAVEGGGNIPDDEPVMFEMKAAKASPGSKAAKVSPGSKYSIRLYGDRGTDWHKDETRLYPVLVTDAAEVPCATIDGEAQPGCLYMEVR